MRNQMRRMAMSVVLLTCLLSSVFSQDEQWLEYKTGAAGSAAGVALKAVRLKVVSTAPEKLTLPDQPGTLSSFARWESPLAKDGGVWLAFGGSGQGTADTLYVDSNCNGSLADEEAIKATATSGNRAQFQAVKVALALGDGETTTYHVNVFLYDYAELKQAAVTSGGWYEGEISDGAEMVRVALVDYNANGTFNDVSSDPAKCDRISVKSGDAWLPSCLGRYLQMGGKLFEVEAAPDGAFVKLRSAGDAPMGTVTLPEEITRIGLMGSGGNLQYDVKDGKISVPEGTWRLRDWTLQRSDPSGVTWIIVASDPSRSPEFEVAGGAESSFDVGEPIVSTVSYSKSGGLYSFTELFKGRYGENLRVERADKAQLQPPRLRIKNADGTYDSVFSFQYG